MLFRFDVFYCNLIKNMLSSNNHYKVSVKNAFNGKNMKNVVSTLIKHLSYVLFKSAKRERV